MRFAKYHGIGNDFIVVDLRAAAGEVTAAWQAPGAAVALCRRRFGVGADGVLAIVPPHSAAAAARMNVVNSDGSIGEMCGNGLRCVARYLHDRAGVGGEFIVDTNAGSLACRVDGEAITVRLGRPRDRRRDIPMTGRPDDTCIDHPYQLPGEPERRLTGINTGNPHAVTFVDSRSEARRLAAALGPTLEHHPWFPLKANVEFAHVRSRQAIDLFVWERACGLTLACGTGASATAVAAVITGRADAGVPIEVALPGGVLAITVARDLSDVAMTGPARHVFDGELDLASVMGGQPVIDLGEL